MIKKVFTNVSYGFIMHLKQAFYILHCNATLYGGRGTHRRQKKHSYFFLTERNVQSGQKINGTFKRGGLLSAWAQISHIIIRKRREEFRSARCWMAWQLSSIDCFSLRRETLFCSCVYLRIQRYQPFVRWWQSFRLYGLKFWNFALTIWALKSPIIIDKQLVSDSHWQQFRYFQQYLNTILAT